MWLPSLRSEAQALGWCCMCSTFLQILLIFSSPEGYRLQFSIPHAYFVYTVWHCTSQHCSSMYACTYHFFVGMWHPLVSYHNTIIILRLFFIVECSIARFLCTMRVFEVRASSSSPRPRLPLCQISFFRCLHCWASPWTEIAYSITHSAYLMPWELQLALWNYSHYDSYYSGYASASHVKELRYFSQWELILFVLCTWH